MRSPLNGIYHFIKNKIMTKKITRIAVKGGRDLDGDLVVYRGHLYWVHVLENIVGEVPKKYVTG